MESSTSNASELTWSPPQVDVHSPPVFRAIGRPNVVPEYTENFFRCAKWCPDGTVALTQCEDRSLQMLKLPTEPFEDTIVQFNADPVFRQPAPILDFIWYPGANAASPSLYCFLASIRDCPVKLLDASDGRLRASYRIVDHRERQVAPHSMAFNAMGSHLYCGCEDAIEVFDFQRPGEGTKLATTPSKKSKDGMKGLISSIAFCPDYSGLFAASSLSSAISLYSEATGEDPIAFLDGMSSAVTQVKFNPSQPHLLYASQRRSNDILCWDVREPLEVLKRYTRKGSRTNQKIMFDIDLSGRWLASGDEDGRLLLYDLISESTEPILSFEAHDDAIGSVSFNPLNSSLLSVSGSRNFHSNLIDTFISVGGSGQPDPDSSDSDTESDGADVRVIRRYPTKPPFSKDSTAKLWTFSTNTVETQVEIGA